MNASNDMDDVLLNKSTNYTKLDKVYSSEIFDDVLVRLIWFDGIRFLQMITGIIGNCTTLKIIYNQKVLRNGQILMVYLAVSDILVCCMVPLASFTAISRIFLDNLQYWNVLCLVKVYLFYTASAFSVSCYGILSFDR